MSHRSPFHKVKIGVISAIVSLFLTSSLIAQTSEIIRTPQRQFAIPFRIEPDDKSDPTRSVELLCSPDFGTTWKSVGQAKPENGKIDFRAPKDGEYWFAFRTISESGQIRQPDPIQAQIRVLVERRQNGGAGKTSESAVAPGARLDSVSRFGDERRRDGPVAPPKPHRAHEKSGDTIYQSGTGDDDANRRKQVAQGAERENVSRPKTTTAWERSGNSPDLSKLPRPERFAPEHNAAKGAKNLRGAKPEMAGDSGISDVDLHEPPPLSDLFAEIGGFYANKNDTAPVVSPESNASLTPPRSVRRSGFKTVPIKPHLTFEPIESVETTGPVKLIEAVESNDKLQQSVKSKTDKTIQAGDPDGSVKTPEPIQPAAKKPVAEAATETKQGVPAVSKSPLSPGRITTIKLQTEQGKKTVLVRWAIPQDAVSDASTGPPQTGSPKAATVRVDLLRGHTAEGPWEPIVVGLENSGEYWWYVSQADFKPFYVAVRTQATDGRFTFDTTRSPIKIDPSMLAK